MHSSLAGDARLLLIWSSIIFNTSKEVNIWEGKREGKGGKDKGEEMRWRRGYRGDGRQRRDEGDTFNF